MKILEINKFNFPKGGADKHFLDVCQLLESEGHQVARFCMRHEKNFPSPWENYFVTNVGYTSEYPLWQRISAMAKRFYSFEARTKIGKLLDEFKPDVVHVHNVYHHISPSIYGEIQKRGIPIIMTVHDYEFISPDREQYHESVGKQYWKFLMIQKYTLLRRILLVIKKYAYLLLDIDSKVHSYIVPSEYVRNIFIIAGINDKKVIVLPHFIPPQSAVQNAEKYEKIDMINEKYAFYFGRIFEEKGINNLISMFKNIDGVKLYLAGETENGFQLGQTHNVRYIGYLSQAELKQYIAGSMCVVSASKLPETFGLIALEAISAGKPFVGLNAGAYGEVVEQGVTGMICHDMMEMETVIKNIASKKLSFDESLIAQKAAQRFSSAAYVQKLVLLFQSCL